MTIAALHHAFEDFVMEWLVELGLDLAVTAHAELRLAKLQHIEGREAWFLGICRTNKSD